MPEVKWRYGYLTALLITLASTVFTYWYFKKKGWSKP
jgi:Mg2+ and Co2+ transporter CorA